jgi:HSP90 family molecular chaperone
MKYEITAQWKDGHSDTFTLESENDEDEFMHWTSDGLAHFEIRDSEKETRDRVVLNIPEARAYSYGEVAAVAEPA